MIAPRIRALIAKHCPDHRSGEVCRILDEECSTTLPGVRADWLELIERIQAGVLRGTQWDLARITSGVRLAQIDWRDLLMGSGFGESTSAHSPWLDEAMRSGKLE